METFEAIYSRRSIRVFKPQAIPRGDIARIIDAARWAPSWKNSQCARFVVIDDAPLKLKISDLMKGNRSCNAVLGAPVLIAVCAELGYSGYSAGAPATEKGDWYMFDSALAVQNILLAAKSLGIGSVVIGLFDAPSVARVIKLPEQFTVINLIALGYPDEHPSPPVRKTLEQVCFHNNFGTKFIS